MIDLSFVCGAATSSETGFLADLGGGAWPSESGMPETPFGGGLWEEITAGVLREAGFGLVDAVAVFRALGGGGSSSESGISKTSGFRLAPGVRDRERGRTGLAFGGVGVRSGKRVAETSAATAWRGISVSRSGVCDIRALEAKP